MPKPGTFARIVTKGPVATDSDSQDPNQSSNPIIAVRRAIRSKQKENRTKQAEEIKLLGNEFFKDGDYSAAAAHYFLAINLRGPNVILLSNLAAAYLKLEAYSEAEWAANAALEYDPNHLKARFRRGTARQENMAFVAAVHDYETILCHDPNCVDAQRQLQECRDSLIVMDGCDLSDDELDEDYPGFNDSPWESHDDSDSAEALHVGKKKSPCRYHNRNGCLKGNLCLFSHAPDDFSVRDDYGRNVCTPFLLGNCKYGKEKCAYSHDRSYLPSSGWWKYPDQVEAAKKAFDAVISLNGDDLNRELRRHRKVKNFAKRQKKEAVLEMLDFYHSAVNEETELDESDSDAWGPLQFPTSGFSIPSEPFVAVVSIEDPSTFNSIHKHLMAALKSKIHYVQALTKADLTRYLASSYLTAVFVTDPFIARPSNRRIRLQLVDFVQEGGTLAFGGIFSTFVPLGDFNTMMSAFGVPWTYGDYFRTTFALNSNNALAKNNPSLASSYSMKTLHVANMRPEDAVYRTTPASQLQSLVFPSKSVNDPNEAPVVQTRVGKGLLGFIGDVNAEVDSTKTTLALLGLLDDVDDTLKKIRQRAPIQDGAVDVATRSKNPDVQPSQLLRHSNPSTSKDGSSSTSAKRRSLIVLKLEKDRDDDTQRKLDEQLDEQLDEFLEAVDILRVYTGSDLSSRLANTDNLAGIYIVDAGITQKENAQALSKVVEYATKEGGNVVIGGQFTESLGFGHLESPFFEFLGLNLQVRGYYWVNVEISNSHPITKKYHQQLPKKFEMKALSVLTPDPHTILYHKDPIRLDDDWVASILQTTVGDKVKGRVGFIGDVGYQTESSKIILAMLDILIPDPPPAEDRQPFVLCLRWNIKFGGSADYTNDDNLLDRIRGKKIEVINGVSNARAVELLKSQDLRSVFVTDASITEPHMAHLLSKIVEYVMNGGTVVFGGSFRTLVTALEFRNFFLHNFGLAWDMMPRTKPTVEVTKNMHHPVVEASQKAGKSKLPSSIKGEMMHATGIDPSTAIYSPANTPSLWSPQEKIFNSPIVYAKVPGSKTGHVGFVGTSSVTKETGQVLLAMLGVE